MTYIEMETYAKRIALANGVILVGLALFWGVAWVVSG
jgi:hypothetical protein